MLPTLSKSSLPVLACRRSISSKTKSQSPHDKRMEALVSLYHQSNTFITPENLSTVIDHAFTSHLNIPEDRTQHSLRDLSEMRRQRSNSQKFFLGRDNSPTIDVEGMGPGWTESRSSRVDRVYRALMGTQTDGRPTWLALKENGNRVKSQIDNDN